MPGHTTTIQPDTDAVKRFLQLSTEGLTPEAVLMLETGQVSRALVRARGLLGPGCQRAAWYALVDWMTDAGLA